MIKYGTGNLLRADADALVNTVNTVGVMGKGIALQFKRAYPEMFKAYERAAKNGEVAVGKMYVWPTEAMDGPRVIVNFPTKRHWRAPSRLADVEAGLEDLVDVVRTWDIKSIAIPPLGCGNGGLDWQDVEPRIIEAFQRLPGVEVMLFAPSSTPRAADMPTATDRPRMTPGRAALVGLLARYARVAADSSLIEVQKLMYFLQEAGEPLRLNFVKGRYGPYADNLRHVLNEVEGHFLEGFGDGSRSVHRAEPIALLPGAEDVAQEVLAAHPETVTRVDAVSDLIVGFETAYGMELLSSVHWIATREEKGSASPTSVAERVAAWNPRKGRMFTERHVRTAWKALSERGWINEARSNTPTIV